MSLRLTAARTATLAACVALSGVAVALVGLSSAPAQRVAASPVRSVPKAADTADPDQRRPHLAVEPSVAAVGTATLSGDSAPPAVLDTPAANSPSTVPVLFLHGALLGPGCVGTDPAGVAQSLHAVLARHEWSGPLLPVDYYCGDAGAGTVDIRGGSRPTADTSIDDLARKLAWYVYRTYSVKQLPVDMVGHSMGGLIMLDAIASAGHYGFPPYLLVRDAVTISAPFSGMPTRTTCPVQCQQMTYGSDFLASLSRLVDSPHSPAGRGGTTWTVLGGSPCDNLPGSSTLSLHGALAIDLGAHSPACYTHVSYLADTSASHDLPVALVDRFHGTRHEVGPRSLEWVAWALER